MNLSNISRNIGLALVLNALFMFISVGVAIYYNFDASLSPLLLSAVITLAVGCFPLLFVRKGGDLNIKEGFFTIVCSWLLSCVFGMLPYILWGGEFSIINAWFESVSGYTTTGSTILNNVEGLPHGLLFWRSSTHFIGGLGVVVFMILIIPAAKNALGLRISKIEISSITKDNYKYRLSQTARIILGVYLGLIGVLTLLLWLTGMGLFDSLNHAMSAVATGGFSTRNLSIAAFQSPGQEVIITIFMYISGLHFGLIYSAVVGRSLRIFKNPIVKFYTLAFLVIIAISTVELLLSGEESNFFTALRHSAFMNVSAGTSTGFATTQTLSWPVVSTLMLFYLSLQGACSGSTTGGIKADRICIWFSSLRARLKKQLNYNAIVRTSLSGKVIEADKVAEVNVFIVFYLGLLFIGATLLAISGMDMTDSLSTSVASLGNIGLTFGNGGAFGSYSDFSIFGKLITTIEMFIGRLEIYPILTILIFKKWK